MATEDLMNQVQETPKESGSIWIGGTIFKMMCPRGHAWTEESSSDQPFHLSLIGNTDAGINGIVKTGPLCGLCLVEFLNERAGATVISATPKYPRGL